MNIKHRCSLADLEYAGSIRCPPRIEEVIFARAHEPFTYETEHRETSADKAPRGRGDREEMRGGDAPFVKNVRWGEKKKGETVPE